MKRHQSLFLYISKCPLLFLDWSLYQIGIADWNSIVLVVFVHLKSVMDYRVCEILSLSFGIAN